MICLIRRHAWDPWQPQESDLPGTMIRVCRRCGAVQDNAPPGQDDTWYRMGNN